MCQMRAENSNDNVIEVLKVSTGVDKFDGPFFDMHKEYRLFAFHPLVAKATNCSKLKPNGIRNTKLVVSDPWVRSTYLIGNQLAFRNKLLEPEQVHRKSTPESSLTDERNLSAKELSQIYR